MQQLIRRTRDKSNGNQDSTNSDGGDSLPATASSSGSSSGIVSPRKSIRDYGDSSGSTGKLYEDSYLLYKGRKSYLMLPLAKAITWLIKIGIYYHHKQYITKRLLIYFSLILIAGLVRDFLLTSPPSPLPTNVLEWINQNLKTHKRNPLNVYFVKLGWLWTFIALIPFFLFTRFYLAKRAQERELQPNQARKDVGRKKSVHFREPLEDHPGGVASADQSHKASTSNDPTDKRVAEVQDSESDETETVVPTLWQFFIAFARELAPSAIRLVVTTLVWYYSVRFFVYYIDISGKCHHSENSTIIDSAGDRYECEKLHGKWHGFDISGHIFLMVFSNLIRIEELSYLYKKFEEFAQFRYLNLSRSRSMNYASPYRFSFSLFHLLALLTVAINVVVTFVWDFMILQTSFFYHTWTQKMAGYGWAVLAWAVTYCAAFTLPQLSLQVA